MYICICNGITDTKIREAIRNGAKTSDEVYAACGVEPVCGTCADMMIEMIIEEETANAKTPA